MSPAEIGYIGENVGEVCVSLEEPVVSQNSIDVYQDCLLGFVSGEPNGTSPIGATHAYLLLISCPLKETMGRHNCSLSTPLSVQGTHSSVCIPLQCCYRRLEKLFLSPDAHHLDFQYPHFSYRICLVNVEINEPPCKKEDVLFI